MSETSEAKEYRVQREDSTCLWVFDSDFPNRLDEKEGKELIRELKKWQPKVPRRLFKMA